MSRCEETSSNNTDLESGLSSVSHSAAILPDTTTGSSCLFYPPAGHEIGRPKSLPNLSIPSLSKLPLSSLSIKLHRTATDRPRSPLGSSPSPTLNDWSRSPTLVLPMPLLSSDDHEFPRGQSMLQRLFDRSWVQPAIGLTTLLITLIALFVYSHRSFVMAKWTEKNDILQACAQLIQVISPIGLVTVPSLIRVLGSLKYDISAVPGDAVRWTNSTTLYQRFDVSFSSIFKHERFEPCIGFSERHEKDTEVPWPFRLSTPFQLPIGKSLP